MDNYKIIGTEWTNPLPTKGPQKRQHRYIYDSYHKTVDDLVSTSTITPFNLRTDTSSITPLLSLSSYSNLSYPCHVKFHGSIASSLGTCDISNSNNGYTYSGIPASFCYYPPKYPKPGAKVDKCAISFNGTWDYYGGKKYCNIGWQCCNAPGASTQPYRPDQFSDVLNPPEDIDGVWKSC